MVLSRFSRTLVLVLTAVGVLSVLATGQGVAELLDSALAADGMGRVKEAVSLLQEAAAAGAASGEEGGRSPEGAALAESAIWLLARLYADGELPAARAREVLEALEESTGGADPVLASAEAAREAVLGSVLADVGDTSGARALSARMGFSPTFEFIGPFDNERMQGFDAVLPPEEEIDLEASYPGKERPVTWRRLPGTRFDGVVTLDAIARPSDQVLGYLLWWLQAEEPTRVALRLGSDEGVAVWVNGHEVLRRRAHRDLRLDQDAVEVDLAEGLNAVLVKLAEAEGSWELGLRVTAPDGTAAPEGVSWLEPDADAPATWSQADPAPSSAHGGGLEVLGELARQRPEDPTVALHHALLLAAVGGQDRNEYPEREELARAVASRPGDGTLLYHLALASQVWAERAADAEENAMREGLERVLEQEPAHVRGLTALGRYYATSLGNLEKGRSYYERAVAANPDFVPAQLGLADVLRRRGWDAEYQLRIQDLVGRFPDSALVARRWAGVREDRGDGAGAAEILAKVYDTARRDRSVLSRLVDQRVSTGDVEAAAALLHTRLELDPYDAESTRELASIRFGNDRPEDAARELEAWVGVAPADADALSLLARIRRWLGEGAAAATLARRVAELDGTDAAARAYAELVDPEGTVFEERFLSSTDLLADEARQREDPADSSLRVVLRRRVMRIHDDGSSTERVQELIKVTSEAGVRRLSQFTVGGGAAVEVERARLFTRDGQVRDCQVRGRRVAPPPPVQVGDVVDVKYRTASSPASYFGNYFGTRLYFGGADPIDRLEYILVVPEGRKLYFDEEAGVDPPQVETFPEEQVVVYRYTAEGLPMLQREPLMPPFDELVPDVVVSTYRDWDAFARWYWSLIEGQHVMDDAMRAKVHELADDLGSVEEKVAAVYHFVISEIRYNAWEFDVHGYKPYEAPTIFGRRFGDCKDKAILLNTLLAELGIEAHPVLIRLKSPSNRGREDLRLPVFEHFNHCISRVILPSGGVFLDGTAQYYGFSHVAPGGDQGARVLVVRQDGGELMDVPFCPPGENRAEEEATLTLAASGSASLDLEMTVNREDAPGFRRALELEGTRALVLTRFLTSRLGGEVQVGEVEVSPLDRLLEPVQLHLGAEVPGWATRRGDQLEVKLALFPSGLGGIASLDRRVHDVVLGVPQQRVSTVRIRLPDGARAGAPPPPIEVEGDFLTYRQAVETTDGEIVVQTELTLKTHRVPVERYEEFRQACVEIGKAERRTVKVSAGRDR